MQASAIIARPGALLLLVLGLTAGCSPFVAPAPLVVAETAEVLAEGRWSATLFGGGGYGGLDGAGGGGGGRIRVGVGGRQELGVEALVLATDSGENHAPWEGRQTYYGGKLSWKLGLASWAALVAGVGGATAGVGPSVGGDLAFIASTRAVVARYYGGARGFFALPVGRPFYEAGGPGGGVMPFHGLRIRLGPSVALFIEQGFPLLFGRGILEARGRTPEDHGHFGIYGALGLRLDF